MVPILGLVDLEWPYKNICLKKNQEGMLICAAEDTLQILIDLSVARGTHGSSRGAAQMSEHIWECLGCKQAHSKTSRHVSPFSELMALNLEQLRLRDIKSLVIIFHPHSNQTPCIKSISFTVFDVLTLKSLSQIPGEEAFAQRFGSYG